MRSLTQERTFVLRVSRTSECQTGSNTTALKRGVHFVVGSPKIPLRVMVDLTGEVNFETVLNCVEF